MFHLRHIGLAKLSRSCFSKLKFLRNFSSSVLPSLSSGPFKSFTLDFTTRELLNSPSSPLAQELAETSSRLKREGANSLWIRALLKQGDVFNAADKDGFVFHHASGTTAYLFKWLPNDLTNKVPPYATHVCGVGGVVIDDNGQVLVVKERSPRFANVGWKFPGGMSEIGENFGNTAAREVFEETGVQSTFQSIISLRHTHNATYFGMSDIYVLCMMKPVAGKAGREIQIDPNEILEAKWMPSEELESSTPHPLIKHAIRTAIHEFEIEKKRREKNETRNINLDTNGLLSQTISETELYFEISKKTGMVYSNSNSSPLRFH
jgi:ADP-ribose pyrophosphatase YjhB (NUDIX family)